MSWFRTSKAEKAKLEETEKFLDETNDRLSEQAPRVNALVGWLEQRKMTNGFGEDFEWTLTHLRRDTGG